MSTPRIEDRLKDLLDETRLVMLGTQLLLGMQYRAAFAQRFEHLPTPFGDLDAVALLLILITAALLLAVPARHRIAESGHATGGIITYATRHLKLAFLPLGAALGLDVAIGLAHFAGTAIATVAGIVFLLLAIGAWYALPLAARRSPTEDTMEDKEQSLETRIGQALTELRVILPGAQALFGFQFTVVLTESFEKLPAFSKGIHFASMVAVALAIILLMAPAAYHRLAANGNAEERVLSYTTSVMLGALALLALAMVGDGFVTIRKIFGHAMLAGAISAALLIGFAVLLYGIPLAARYRRIRLVGAAATSN